MEYHKRYRSFEDRFILFSNFMEKIIWKSLLLFMAAMVISQLLLSFDLIRIWLVPVEYLEGTMEKLQVLN